MNLPEVRTYSVLFISKGELLSGQILNGGTLT
jgi:hypothetical protein